MLGSLVKSVLVLAGLTAGAVLVVNTVPSLKANILEVVNPRAKEARLIKSLTDNLDTLDEDLSRVAGAAAGGTSTAAKNKKLVDESQALLKEIADINQEHSGLVSGVVDSVVDSLIGTTSTVTPTTTPATTSTSAPNTVYVTVTVTPAPSVTPPPCTAQ